MSAWTAFFGAVFENEVFRGGVWLAVLGGLSGFAWLVVRQLWETFTSTFLITITLTNSDEAFNWMILWLSKQKSFLSSQNLKMVLRRDNAGQANWWSSMLNPDALGESAFLHAVCCARVIRWPDWCACAAEVPKLDFLPAQGFHIFRYKGRVMWLSRDGDKWITTGFDNKPFQSETLTLTTLGRDKGVFEQLFKEAIRYTEDKDRDKTVIYTVHSTRDSMRRPWSC